MARGWHCTKLSLSSALLSFSGMCFHFVVVALKKGLFYVSTVV